MNFKIDHDGPDDHDKNQVGPDDLDGITVDDIAYVDAGHCTDDSNNEMMLV